jgi:hypothetical protein
MLKFLNMYYKIITVLHVLFILDYLIILRRKIMKKIQKYSSIILIITMLMTIMPGRVLANVMTEEMPPALVNQGNTEINERLPGVIVHEVEEKREKYVKHFFKDYISYEAAMYPVPVHYMSNGKWKEIDNSLVEQEEGDDDSGTIQNKENSFKIKFSKKSSSKKLVQIQKDKYKLYWNFDGAQEARLDISTYDESRLNVEIEERIEKHLQGDKKYEKKTSEEKGKIKEILKNNEKRKSSLRLCRL